MVWLAILFMGEMLTTIQVQDGAAFDDSSLAEAMRRIAYFRLSASGCRVYLLVPALRFLQKYAGA